jgi:hypothetical protein
LRVLGVRWGKNEKAGKKGHHKFNCKTTFRYLKMNWARAFRLIRIAIGAAAVCAAAAGGGTGTKATAGGGNLHVNWLYN